MKITNSNIKTNVKRFWNEIHLNNKAHYVDEVNTNEQFKFKLNDEKIKYMLSKEQNCLNKWNKKTGGRKGLKNVGEVLKDLDDLSDNVVKYLNVPKVVKKNIHKK